MATIKDIILQEGTLASAEQAQGRGTPGESPKCVSSVSWPLKIKEEPIEIDGNERNHNDIMDNLPIHFESTESSSASPTKPVHRRGRKKGSKNKIKVMLPSTKESILIPKVSGEGQNVMELMTKHFRLLPKLASIPDTSKITHIQPVSMQQQLFPSPVTQLSNNSNVLPIASPQQAYQHIDTSLTPSSQQNESQDFNPKIEQVFFTGWKKDLNGIAPEIGIPLPVPTSKVLIEYEKKVKKLKIVGQKKENPALVPMCQQPSAAPVMLHPFSPGQPMNTWPAMSFIPQANIPLLQHVPFMNANAPIQVNPQFQVLLQPPVLNVASSNPLLIPASAQVPPAIPVQTSFSVNNQHNDNNNMKPASTNANKLGGSVINCVTPVSVANQFIFLPNISTQQSTSHATPVVAPLSSMSTASIPTNSMAKSHNVSPQGNSCCPNQIMPGIPNVVPVNNLGSNTVNSSPVSIVNQNPSNVVINVISPSSLPANLLSTLSQQVGPLYNPMMPMIKTFNPKQDSPSFQNGLTSQPVSQQQPAAPAMCVNSLNLLPNFARSKTNPQSSSSSSYNPINDRTFLLRKRRKVMKWKFIDVKTEKFEKKAAPVKSILNKLRTIKPKSALYEVSVLKADKVNTEGGDSSSSLKSTGNVLNLSIANPQLPVVHMNAENVPNSATSDTSNMFFGSVVRVKEQNTHNIKEHSKCSNEMKASDKLNLILHENAASQSQATSANSSVFETPMKEKTDLNLLPFMNWFVDNQPQLESLNGTPTLPEVCSTLSRPVENSSRINIQICGKEIREKNLSQEMMSKLSFKGDIGLLNHALTKCTVSLERLSHDQIQEALKYCGEREKPQGKHKVCINNEDVDKKPKFDSESCSLSKKLCHTGKAYYKKREKLQKYRGCNRENQVDHHQSKERKITDSTGMSRESSEESPVNNETEKSFSDVSMSLTPKLVSFAGTNKRQSSKEWIPFEVVRDLAIKGQVREYSGRNVSTDGSTRRSPRIESKPRMDYVVMERGMVFEEEEEEAVDFPMETKMDLELIAESVQTVEEGDAETERQASKKETKDGREMDERPSKKVEKVNERNSDQAALKLNKESSCEVVKEGKLENVRNSDSISDDETHCSNENKTTVDAKQTRMLLEDDDQDCHYSSESDSDLFDDEQEVEQYKREDKSRRMHLLMKRHNQVTMYLLKFADKFSTVEEGDKMMHVCKECNVFRTNGLFRLFKHLRAKHSVD